MKLEAIFAICCLICSTTGSSLGTSTYSVNDQLRNMLERSRVNFHCGFPELGIPVLEPLEISDFSAKIYSLLELNSLEFTIKNSFVHNLSTFVINHVSLAVLRMTMEFDITVPEIRVDGNHRTRAIILDRLPITLIGNGGYTMILRDVRITGTIRMNTVGGRLNIREMEIGVKVDSVKSDVRNILGPITKFTFNRILERVLPDIINNEQEMINEIAAEQIKPLANSVLNELTMIDLINMIADSVNRPNEPWC